MARRSGQERLNFNGRPSARGPTLRKMNPNIQPGTRLSHYKIVSLLGAGGTGEVCLAGDTELNRPVASKFLHADLATD